MIDLTLLFSLIFLFLLQHKNAQSRKQLLVTRISPWQLCQLLATQRSHVLVLKLPPFIDVITWRKLSWNNTTCNSQGFHALIHPKQVDHVIRMIYSSAAGAHMHPVKLSQRVHEGWYCEVGEVSGAPLGKIHWISVSKESLPYKQVRTSSTMFRCELYNVISLMNWRELTMIFKQMHLGYI